MLTVLVRHPSGTRAIYRVHPDYMDQAAKHGKQLAHELYGRWYFPGGWIEIPTAQVERLKNLALEITS